MDWLDLARYADTYGYQADVERDMSPYRDWVIGAFNRNLPYDQFLTWQLAGDLLPNPTREQRIATAFNRLHRQTNEGGSIEEEFRTEYVVDRVNTFGTSMLGLTRRVRPLPRSQVRPDHAARLLLAVRVLQQHRRVGPLLAFHQRDAEPVAAAVAGRRESRSIGGSSRRDARDRSRAAAAAPRRPDRVRRARPRDADRAAGADRAPGVRHASTATRRRTRCRKQRRRVEGQRRSPLVGAVALALRFSGDNSVVHPGVADLRPHRPVLAGAAAAAHRAAGARRRSCTSRAPGPTPAAAASS